MAELVSRIKPTHQYIFILNIYEKLPHPAQPQIQKLGITHILTRFHNKILISRSGSHLLTLAGDAAFVLQQLYANGISANRGADFTGQIRVTVTGSIGLQSLSELARQPID